MGRNTDKTKFSIRVDTKLLEMCDEHLGKTNAENRTEFIETALKNYISFITSQNIEDYLLKSLSSVLTSTVYDSEHKICRALFKLTVALNRLTHIIAHESNMDDETMRRLLAMSVQEVKKLNGFISFENAYDYQHENDTD